MARPVEVLDACGRDRGVKLGRALEPILQGLVAPDERVDRTWRANPLSIARRSSSAASSISAPGS